MAFDTDVAERLERDAKEIIARYPQPRSALLPLLHLVQAEEGHVTQDGIDFCAAQLGITAAQVEGVVTFYTMYKQHPVGDYHVGVCINTLCAVMGGDQIWRELTDHIGAGEEPTADGHAADGHAADGHAADGRTADGKVTVERIECNAACDYAPVMTVNWEFFDNMTPEKAKRLVDDLRAGKPVAPTRGSDGVCTWRQASRILAGFPDGRAHEGLQAGPESLRGLRLADERGWTAPAVAPDAGNSVPEANK